MICSSAKSRRVRGWLASVLVLAGAGVTVVGQETCETASPLVVGGTIVGSNAAAADDAPASPCAATSHDVWHVILPTTTGMHTISLCGSGFDTVATFYLGCGPNAQVLACNDDACGSASQIVASLTSFQPYMLRIGSKAGMPGGTYQVTVTAQSPTAPSNNVCGAPVILQADQTLLATTNGATGTDLTASCGTLDRNDVWFSFVPTTSGQHIVEVCTSAFDPVISIHNRCVLGTVLACTEDAPLFGCTGTGARLAFNGVAGSVFLVRVAGTGDGFGPFSIRLNTAQEPDQCARARFFTMDSPVSGVISPAMGTELSSSCAPSSYDAWHAFSPLVSGPHTFALCDADFDSVLSVHTGCPEEGGAMVGCDDNGCSSTTGQSAVTVGLNAGQRYLVRVAGKNRAGSAPPNYGRYTLTAAVTSPPNDACQNATNLALGTPMTVSSAGATGEDLTTCGENDAADIWYTFTPPTSGMYEFSSCGSVIDTTLALFSSCSQQAACGEDAPGFCGAGKGSRLTVSLTAGVGYLVRVAGVHGATGTIRLVVGRVPPANDTCATAAALTLDVPVAGTLSGAMPTGFTVATCDTTADSPDVYFTFTPAVTRHYRISTCGSGARTVVTLLGNCPPSPIFACAGNTAALCGQTNGTLMESVLQAGTTYVIRVGLSGDAQASSFQIVVSPTAPTNDTCEQAARLTLQSFGAGSNIDAGGVDATPCGGGDSLDVWYVFTPALGGTYEFSTCVDGASSLDTTLAVFDGCGGSVLACNDNDAGACPGATRARLSRVSLVLEAGLDYLVRVAGAQASQGSFYVGVVYGRPANDTCGTAATVGIGSVRFDTLGAETDPLFMSSCGLGFNLISNDIWFRFTPPTPGTYIVNLCGSTFDTALAISDDSIGCAGPTMPVAACADDDDCDNNSATPVSPQSRVAFVASPSRSYLVRVGSRVGQRGSGTMTILPPGLGCPCDWNRVDGRTVQDVFDFLTDFFAGQADYDQSGSTQIQDLFDFLDCYLTPPLGC